MHDDDDFDAMMRDFQRRFMRRIDGTNIEATSTDALQGLSDEEIREFERMVMDLFAPAINAATGMGLNGVRVIRAEGSKNANRIPDPDADLSWLDKYL